MLVWTLITVSSLLASTFGHVTIDGSKGSTHERIPVGLNGKDMYQEHFHRSLALEKEFKLQLNWWNWNLCTNAYPNASFTTKNSFVPNNTVFLAGYPTYNLDNSSATCKSKTVTRNGTIGVGEQTVFFPVVNYLIADVADDWQEGCGATFPNETDALRLSQGVDGNAQYTNSTFKETVYLIIDGKNVTPAYLYDTTFYLLSACDDNRTQEEYYKSFIPDYSGDTCDFEPYQTIGGLDVGPMNGYYGIDTRSWVDGESHTYEFGSLELCITAKYILTAKAPPTKAPTKAPSNAPVKLPTKAPTKAPVEEGKCGLFGLGIFCPFAWLKWFFGLFT